MKMINEDIKTKEYKHVYLLCGEEAYLKRQYKEKLREAVLSGDTMNYSYFEGDGICVREMIEIGDTMPFFAKHRLIIAENTGFFKSANEELANYIKNMPEYLIMVFVESETDKRNKVYKAVSEVGYVCEMKPPSAAVLEQWISGLVKAEGKTIEKSAVQRLLDKSGLNMDSMHTELDKLLAYCMDQARITAEDVEAVCATQTESRIFDMIAAIASKRQQQALSLYYDLLTQKEPPMRILYLLVRQFNGILQVKELTGAGRSQSEAAREMGVAPFVVGKYISQAKQFLAEELKQALRDFADIEEQVKTGRIADKIGVELMIVKYSSRSVLT